MNRITAAIEKVRPRIEALSPEKAASLRETLSVTPEEHFAYQTAQSVAHASGRITPDEAQTIYAALGAWSSDGWRTSDLATIVVVTQVLAELIGVKS